MSRFADYQCTLWPIILYIVFIWVIIQFLEMVIRSRCVAYMRN